MLTKNGINLLAGENSRLPEMQSENGWRETENGVFPYIPKTRQQRAGLLIDFFCLRGTSASQNFVDLLMLGENRFGILLAEIPAGFAALVDEPALIKAALRDQKTATSTAATLRTFDTLASSYSTASEGIRAYYTIINQQNRSISFSSAGHLPMIVYRSRAERAYLLNCEGNELGLAPQASRDVNGRMKSQLPRMTSETVRARQHDLIVLFSSGLLQAKNSWGENFSMQRLLDVIKAYGHMQPTPFLTELQNALDEFMMGETPMEDITVVALKNMLSDVDEFAADALPEIEDHFLTFEEEEFLRQTSERNPEARISELMVMLGDRYLKLGHERVRFCLTNGLHYKKNGRNGEAKPKKKLDGVEKYFQRELLKAFPIRQLLYSKYEFRGNTSAIAKALEFYQNGNFQESLIEFLKVRHAIAKSESVHCFFGNLYLLLNMSIKARQEYVKALRLNPHCVHAHLALAYIALLHEDYEGTINSLMTALRLDSQLPEYEKFVCHLVRSLEKQSGAEAWLA